MTSWEQRSVQLSWIAVSHESVRDLQRLLPSLDRALDDLGRRGFESEILVVDNASLDGSAQAAQALAPRARVFRCHENTGYGAAMNAAARQARGGWIAMGNADLLIPAGGLERLPGVLARSARDVAVLGPAIREPEGGFSPSAGRFPSLPRLLAGLARRGDRRKYLPVTGHRAGRVDWVTGACMFVRREVFLAAGGFDPRFFLYYEDVDLARRLADAGHRTRYEPRVQVVHVRPHHARPPRAEIESIVRTSRTAYFRKHRPLWESLCVTGLTRLEPMLRRRARSAAGEPLSPGAPVAVLRPVAAPPSWSRVPDASTGELVDRRTQPVLPPPVRTAS